MGLIFFISFILLAPAQVPGRAQVLDRIAVTVGTDVFTESEVLEQIRLTAFLNGQPPDESPAARRQAADRLVDQDLIRREMTESHYPAPPASEAAQMLDLFKRSHFADDAAYRAALARYQITDEQLKARLLWQLTALRFTDQRFHGGQSAPVKGEAARAANPPASAGIDRQLDAWLQETRKRTRIRFREEAFE